MLEVYLAASSQVFLLIDVERITFFCLASSSRLHWRSVCLQSQISQGWPFLGSFTDFGQDHASSAQTRCASLFLLTRINFADVSLIPSLLVQLSLHAGEHGCVNATFESLAGII